MNTLAAVEIGKLNFRERKAILVFGRFGGATEYREWNDKRKYAKKHVKFQNADNFEFHTRIHFRSALERIDPWFCTWFVYRFVDCLDDTEVV